MEGMGQPEPAGSDSSVLRKRATPEMEVAQLRRSMIQHLTASGKLLQAVFAIDREYFGSRFHGAGQIQDTAADPFQELALATKVVETLGEELQGAAAFADSPVLRETVAALVASVDETRVPAMELERLSLEAVGLPGQPMFAARTFPHNNPLACITEATGFLQEIHWLIKRAIDRLSAMKLMLNESERAQDGEHAHGVRPEELTAVLTAELKSRELELKTLREQVAAFQEQSNNDRRKTEAALEAEIESAVIELERERDMRVSDHAEVRSLASEIERLAAIEYEDERQVANPDVNLDDLRNSLTSLRSALKGDSADAITVAADSVLIAWFRLNAAQSTAHAAEIAVLRTQQRMEAPDGARSRDTVKALEEELERLRTQAHNEAAEAARLRSDLVQFGNLSQDYVREKERAKEAAATAAAELAKARETIVQARQKERQLEIELGKLRDAQAPEAGGAEARANEELRKQLAEAGEELAKLRPLARERDELSAKLEDLRRNSSVATEKARSETGEIRAHAQTLRDQIMKAQENQDALTMERDALRSRLEDLRKTTEASSNATTQEQGKATREITALRDAEAKLRGQAAAAASEKERLQARLDQAERELHESREHLAARAREHAQALEQLRAREVMARDHSRASNDELAHVRTIVTRLESELKQSRDKIAAMTATQEQLRQQHARAAADNERLQQRERSASSAGQGEAAMRDLLQQAREAVKQAKLRQEKTDAADRAIIAGLMKQIDDLKRRLKTEKA